MRQGPGCQRQRVGQPAIRSIRTFAALVKIQILAEGDDGPLVAGWSTLLLLVLVS